LSTLRIKLEGVNFIMKNWQYYLNIFVEEFNDQMSYNALKMRKSQGNPEEKLLKDIKKCNPALYYLNKYSLE